VDVEEEEEKWCCIWHHHYQQQQQHATSAQKNERVETMHVKNRAFTWQVIRHNSISFRCYHAHSLLPFKK
jgi:hypothetical protein